MSTPAGLFILAPLLILVGGAGLAAVQIGWEIARDRRRRRAAADGSRVPPAARLA